MKPHIPPPLIGLLAAIITWAFATVLPGLNVSFPAQKFIALGIGGTGLLIDIISVMAFFKAKTTINPLTPNKTQELVVSGLYRFSRNPMYLGMLLMLIGWTIWLGTPLGIIMIFQFVVIITLLQIKPEETALEAKFGNAYLQYKTRVRRWI